MIRLMLAVLIITQITGGVSSKGQLITLTEDTWSDMLKGEWFIEFYAPWCPACRGMQSIWEDFATWSDDLGIEIAQIDVTKNPSLSGRFMVTSLPTFYHVKDGVFRQYRGSRSKGDLIALIEDKKWEEIEPVPSWTAPQSIPMYCVGQFFKLSMVLRSIHNHFVDNFGIPYWGSYVIFAVGTIIIGTILGLILVCFIDYVFPSKPLQLPPVSRKDDLQEKVIKEEEKIPEKEDSDQENELRKRKVDTESKSEEDKS